MNLTGVLWNLGVIKIKGNLWWFDKLKLKENKDLHCFYRTKKFYKLNTILSIFWYKKFSFLNPILPFWIYKFLNIIFISILCFFSCNNNKTVFQILNIIKPLLLSSLHTATYKLLNKSLKYFKMRKFLSKNASKFNILL